jgi:Leucine-rich repeat (LRR) protein
MVGKNSNNSSFHNSPDFFQFSQQKSIINMNNFQELTNFLDKYKKQYIIHSDCVEVEGDLCLNDKKLTSLPESFGNLKIGGGLYLHENNFTSLPESFGNLKIGGSLWLDGSNLRSLPKYFGNLKIGGSLELSYNKLKSLPESFGNLKIDGDLGLSNNKLESLPESFGNLKIGDGLYLDVNNLTSLPESFGNLKIGGSLNLSDNKLESLPESFGNLKIGDGLNLSDNKLKSLPELFGNLKIGGNLLLNSNNLTSLPESFGNLKIGSSLYLNNNKLESLPYIPAMNQTIKKDWCYIDGIVREIVSKKTLGELTIIKTPFDYIVGKDNTWAHGRTIEEATKDYHFKLMKANPDALKDIDLDKPLSHEEAIDIYRAVTRACRGGIRQWMSGKTFPEQITIREIINLTQSAYGGEEFKKFFLP